MSVSHREYELQTLLRAGSGFLALLIFWHLSTGVFGLIPSIVLPAPMEVYNVCTRASGLILDNLWVTVLRAAIGFTAALILAVILGVTMTANESLREGLMPLIVSGNSIPRVAMAPVIIFYIGGFQSHTVIAAWVAFFPLLVNTLEGLNLTNEDTQNLLQMYNTTTWQEYKLVRIPNALPFIFDGMKVSVNLAIVGAIVGEYVAAQKGIGFLALFALQNFNVALVIGLVGIMAVIGLILFLLLFFVQDRVVHWEEATMFPGAGS